MDLLVLRVRLVHNLKFQVQLDQQVQLVNLRPLHLNQQLKLQLTVMLGLTLKQQLHMYLKMVYLFKHKVVQLDLQDQQVRKVHFPHLCHGGWVYNYMNSVKSLCVDTVILLTNPLTPERGTN